ncbi:Transposase IS66 family protein [Legionella geestiana]|uniref:Transposase IS66 family protein n=1 Tax=Legionella geestiana TaxID=45065 RepID=A0A0W0U9R1_9GAMM|nr:transposase [Legionella geestiana]KTD04527.1 Transposase IS66 family protein [Legionella geestiana]QBS12293.1 transposase [Legionella geestiana]STX52969.1 Putative transposase [Legionella geestiana]
MSGSELPKIVDKTGDDIEAAIAAIESSDLSAGIKEFTISCVRLAVWLPKALLEQKIKLSNLRKLIFGQGGPRKKNKADKKDSAEKKEEAEPPVVESGESEDTPLDGGPGALANSTKPQGHGRLAHTKYSNAIEHTLAISGLKPGDLCPEGCSGKLYRFEPGILVRIKGQNLAAVHKYHVEKLRCTTCGYLIRADIPEGVGKEKYDAAFKAILALQKYYVAVPVHRQFLFQSLLNMPLPVSTQWQLIEEVGSAVIPVFNALETLAANMELVHADDSHVKITHLIHQKRINPSSDRTGMFTTGILARSGNCDIALFYNGTRHADENLERLLAKRDPDKTPVIHMCDALSRNIPATFKTILCNCLSHGLRKFDDLKSFYPAPCLHIIKEIGKVYEHDEKTKALTHEERLRWHQQHSKPVMDELYQYIHHQLDSRQVEPNDSLGRAMRYMLKHWHELTQFLRVAGAPLDNNVLERALKIPIRGRRTWLFYKTEYGAFIGGVITSVIYTCALARVNPLTYLKVLLEYKTHVVKEPKRWLPWNYQDKLASLYAKAA